MQGPCRFFLAKGSCRVPKGSYSIEARGERIDPRLERKSKMEINTKKKVNNTLGNIFLKMEAFLLNKNGETLRDFQKRFDKLKREITASRGKNSELKRVYSVELEAMYRYIAKMFNVQNLTAEEVFKKVHDKDFKDNDFVFFCNAFGDFDPESKLSDEELDIFENLDEDDMKRNIYLGVDCSPDKKEEKAGKSNLAEVTAMLKVG